VPSTTVPERFLRDAERFVALVSAIIVRTLVVRVVRGLSIAALLGGTLLAGHLLYTFPGRRFWFMLDFCALALVAIVSVRLLISLERDHVLSRLWSSAPGRVGLTSGLLWRAVATASLPLITLLAVKFPEVGGSLLAWIEPVRQMMPMP
jgi:membrane protein YdbS with pleckstrin-like domain